MSDTGGKNNIEVKISNYNILVLVVIGLALFFTGGKTRTTILLFVVWSILAAIFSMMALSICNSNCNKKRRDTYLVLLYLIIAVIFPYYILVNMWGLTKVFVVLMVFNLFGIISRFQQNAAQARRISEFRARAKA